MTRALPWLLLALRVAIGGLLIFAGALKAHDGAAATATTIAGYRLGLAPAFVVGLGAVLPYLEIFLGGYLLLGFFVRVAAWIAAAQFVVFSLAVASLVIRNIPADCGCFGSSMPVPPSWGHVAIDVGLALASVALALYGPGAYALDAAHSSGGDDEPSAEASQAT